MSADVHVLPLRRPLPRIGDLVYLPQFDEEGVVETIHPNRLGHPAGACVRCRGVARIVALTQLRPAKGALV